METSKEDPMEQLSKGELIEKCKRLRLLAQKAKQSKDECSNELKLSKETENQLRQKLSAMKDNVITSAENEEAIIRLKYIEDQHSKIQNELQGKTSSLAEREAEVSALQKTLDKLSEKISSLEIRATEDNEKLLTLRQELSQVKEENKDWQLKAVEYQTKLKSSDERYGLLDVKFAEFKNQYLSEKKKHSELEALLGKLEKAEKSESERSESRDGLATLAETEGESLAQKLDETSKIVERYKADKEILVQKVALLEKELQVEREAFIQVSNTHSNLVEKCLNQCAQFMTHVEGVACEFNEKVEAETRALKELKETNEHLSESAQVSDRLKEVLAENNAMQELIIKQRTTIADQELQLHDLSKNIATLRNKEQNEEEHKSTELNRVIESLNGQLLNLKEEKKSVTERLIEVQQRLDESTRASESLEATFNVRCEEHNNLKKKMEEYDSLLPKLQKVWRDAVGGKQELSLLKEDLTSDLAAILQESGDLSRNVMQVVEDFARTLAERNAELLSEMNMMNQVLKERGEIISKLEECNSAFQAEAAEKEARYKKIAEKFELAQGEVSSLQEELAARDKTLREMEEEIWRLRSADSPAADGLSTSTMSRVEESQRLADLEGSFEERYNKLKMLAVKLKRKVNEQQSQLESERMKLVGERDEFTLKLATMQTQINALSALQCEYDALQDKSESQHREASELRKSLNKVRDEANAIKLHSEEQKSELSKFAQEKATFDMIKKELTSQIQGLKKNIEKEQGRIRQLELEREQLQGDMNHMAKKLEEEKEQNKQTSSSLVEERHKQKKQSLLSLEMADYERTVNEMTKKLTAKDDQIRELTANLVTQRELSKTLQDSVNGLESRVAAEQASTDASKSRQNALYEEMGALRGEVASITTKLGDVERVARERELELESLKMELSNSLAEASITQERSRIALEMLKSEVRNTEEKRIQLQGLLDRRELELEELRKEFESYKVRAQSVLRQSQKDGLPGRQLDIEQQLVQLKASYDATKAKYEEAAKCLEQVTQDYRVASENKTRLQSKTEEMQREIAELSTANAQLQAAEQRVRETADDSARMARIQQDTLVQCYKREIEELQTKHQEELEACKTAQQQAETALQLHLRRPLTPPHRRQPSSGFVPVRSERETLDVLMLEREACEGSESVESSSPRVVPLEQLLFSQPAATSNSTQQWADKLDKCENRVQHLTSLLADAESDAARLQELNQVLKEEIRRKERNIEREEHSSNLEYLKNVVIKFATLPRGDERLRLVPVLHTILKLSREEQQRLCVAAKGDVPVNGWGAYLGGMWTGAQ